MTRVEDFSRKIVFDCATSLLYSPEIKPEVKGKIKIISEFLAQNPEYSFVVYFNHISYNDPAPVIHVIDKLDPKHSRHLVTFVSHSHTNPDDGKHRAFYLMYKGLQACGIEAIRVIQAYQVDNEDYSYTREQATQNYRQLMNRLKELRDQKVPTGIIISPEGTRSKTGQLAGGEAGMVGAGRLLAPIIYIPVAISYLGEFGRDKVNFFKKMRINIGEVTVQETPKEYPEVEDLMANLATALPEEMRGIWRQE